MLGEDRRHPLAVLQALARHRHQKLQRYLRRDPALAHLLLNGFRQNLHQRQPARYPAHATIEPARQLIQPIAKALLQLGQQPTHLQRGLVFAQPQRAVQQHGRGLAHRPYHRLHRVPAQLLQRRDPLVAVDDHVTVPPGLRPPPRRWVFADRTPPGTPTTGVAAPDGAPEGAPSVDRAGETPVAFSLNVRPAPPADQYVRIKSRARFQRRSRSPTRSSARRQAWEQKRCRGLRRVRTNRS
jgi:hypothetical protein